MEHLNPPHNPDPKPKVDSQGCTEGCHYGPAPHTCFYKIPGAKLGQSVLLPESEWPDTFESDQEVKGLGVHHDCGWRRNTAALAETDTDDARCGSVTLSGELRFRHEHDLHNTPGYSGSVLCLRTEKALRPPAQDDPRLTAASEYGNAREMLAKGKGTEAAAKAAWDAFVKTLTDQRLESDGEQHG